MKNKEKGLLFVDEYFVGSPKVLETMARIFVAKKLDGKGLHFSEEIFQRTWKRKTITLDIHLRGKK